MSTNSLIASSEGKENCMRKSLSSKKLTKYVFIFLNLLLMYITYKIFFPSFVYKTTETITDDWLIGDFFSRLLNFYILNASLMFFSGLQGIVYAAIENPRLLNFYGALLVVQFVLTLVTCGAIIAGIISGSQNLKETFTQAMQNYESDSFTRNTFDSLQHFYNCCGFDGASDWAPYMNRHTEFDYLNREVETTSCCPTHFRLQICTGCSSAVRNHFSEMTIVTLVATGLIGTFLAISMMLGFRLRKQIIKSRNVITLSKTPIVATIMPSEKINHSGFQNLSSDRSTNVNEYFNILSEKPAA